MFRLFVQGIVMKIIQVVSNLSLGGAQRLLFDICRYLNNRNDVEIRVITIDSGEFVPLFRDAGLDVRDLRRKGLVNPLIVKDLISEFRNYSPDIVHTHLQKADFYGRLGAVFSGVKNICSTYHGYSTSHKTASDEQPGLLDKLDDITIRISNSRLIAVSESVKHFLINRSQHNKDRVCIIYNGIDTSVASSRSMSDKEVSDLRQKFNATCTTKLVLISGRIEPAKGQFLFLKAVECLFREFDDLRVVILGKGSDEVRIHEFIRSKGLEDRVFMPGFVLNPKPYYEISDIVAVPSMWEGFGLAAIEGMVLGKIVITSDVGGLKEVVNDGINGFTFKCGDEADLRSKLRIVLSQMNSFGELKRQAANDVIDRFNIRSSSEAYYRLYAELINNEQQKV